MKVIKEDNVIDVDPLTLINGDLDNSMFVFIDSLVNKENDVVIFDLSNCWTISVKGLYLLNQVISYARKKYLFPILISEGFLKKILLKSGFNKSVEIFNSIPEEIDRNESVMDMEKNLLWMSQEDFDE